MIANSVLQVPIVNGNKLPSIHIVQPQQTTARPGAAESSTPQVVPAMSSQLSNCAEAFPKGVQGHPAVPLPPPPPPYPARPLSSSATTQQQQQQQQQSPQPYQALPTYPPRPHSLPTSTIPDAATPVMFVSDGGTSWGWFRCSRCHVRFQIAPEDGGNGGSAVLEQHCAAVHSGARMVYCCGQCGKAFPEVGSMADHAKVAHFVSLQQEQLPRRCKQEQSSPPPPLSQQQQQQQHVCPLCGESFSTKGPLKQHFQQRHFPAMGISVPTTNSSPMECITCRRAFSSRSALRRHQQQMHGGVVSPVGGGGGGGGGRSRKSPQKTSRGRTFSSRTPSDSRSKEACPPQNRKEPTKKQEHMEKIVIPSPDKDKEEEEESTKPKLPEPQESEREAGTAEQRPDQPLPKQRQQDQRQQGQDSPSKDVPLKLSKEKGAEFLCAKCGKGFRHKGSFTVHSIVCGKSERRAEDKVKDDFSSDVSSFSK